ncbi:hypothetical protein LOTGIDRAFT_154521 [Lottia gigantea]|uniref:Uncharacterized protein n=1 Tax=Lottia gigantea TaxID=225164 RepID=V3ZRR7_LOTGI|nr:hypothetical protein LOTGIDRAFT_154521 [Lottia gigantea]ESO87037.1 hypothetical protein LOTGIDRAFT_154521 [Lottia gigantea]
MEFGIVLLLSCLCIGAVFSQTPPLNATYPSIAELLELLEKDGFGELTTRAISDPALRKRRSALLGHLGADSCGSHPSPGVTFVRCFTVGRTYIVGTTYERNYWRYGDYGDCLNYYNSLPLTNVAPIGDGYTGTWATGNGRVYQVDACQRCFGGNSGISVQCNDSPFNNYKRNFIFRVNMGIQRAYDGYHGYGREYANPCVGVACETAVVVPAAPRVVDPCVGAHCAPAPAFVGDNGCVSGGVC